MALGAGCQARALKTVWHTVSNHHPQITETHTANLISQAIGSSNNDVCSRQSVLHLGGSINPIAVIFGGLNHIHDGNRLMKVVQHIECECCRSCVRVVHQHFEPERIVALGG